MRDTFSRLYRGAALAKVAPPRATMLRGWSSIRAALSLARKQWWVKPRVRMTLGALLVAAAYYVSTLIGLSVRFQSSPISPIWPPNTIVLVALLLVPMQTWWVYLLAVFGAHLLIDLPSGIPLATTMGLYFTNCAEAVLGAFLVRSLGGGPPWLGNLRRVTVYIICAVLLAPVLTSFVDAAVVVLTRWGGDYWLNWESRTVSNMLAELTIGPALLLALTSRRWMRGASRWRWVEAGLLTAGVLLVGIVVFGGEISWRGSTPALVYTLLPLLLWAAIRFGTRGTTFALLGTTLMVTWSAARGYGPFSADSPDVNVISLQLFLIGLCVPLLLLAGLMQEHRGTEQTLQESEARYRDLVESQTDMICRYLPDSTLTFVNEAFCRFYGKPRHRLIGTKFVDLVDDAAREHHVRYIETLLKTTVPSVDEHEIALPDGRVGWQQWIDHAIRDAAGNVVEIQSIGRDITDRRRADEALKESEMRFRAAFESAATGMMLVDTTGRALQVNRPLADTLGYSQEELLGRPFTELTHPDDVEPNLELFRSALTGEIDDYQLEKRFIHKQGHLVWTFMSAGVVRDAAGQPRYFIGQMQDITERKRIEEELRASEERYRAVVSNFPRGVVLLFEQDLRHIFADGQGLPNVELSKEAVEGKRLGEVFPAEISAALEPKYQAALAGAGSAFDLAYAGRTYQTQVLPVEYGGRTAGMAIMQDVTEQRQAEVLAELDRAKTAFFSNVSHELRTPLTLLLAPAADALADREAPLPPRQRERLELIRRGGLRLHKLVDTLLTFSRIEAGHIQATYVPTDVATLTADLASAFRSGVERAGLRLVVDCPPLDDLPQPAYVDRDMWEQIVLNLISNALKFTPAGEISVSVRRTGNRDECIDECIKVEVRDTGIGIPAEDLPHIFERFYRVQNARTLTTEGTGIGLALVRDLVRLHGGVVRATSELDVGSAFTVTIPVGTAHLPDGRVARREPPTNRRIEPVRTSVAMLFAQEALLRQPEPPRVPLLPPAPGGVAWDGNVVVVAAAQPQAPASAGDRGAQEAGSKSRVSPSRATRPTILVADDHDDMRAYLVRLLSSHWDVRTAANGVSALAAAREHRVDLILADVIMPGLDGFGLVSTLRANPQTSALPVILLSARAGDEATVEGLQAGADDYLIKPFSSRELLARVRTHLDLARARREAEAHAAQLGAIFEAIGDGVLVQDLDGRDRHANGAFRDLLRRHLELRGHHVEPDALIDAPEQWEDFIAPADEQGRVIPREQWATARALQGEILTGAKAVDEFTQGANGELLQLNVSAAPIRNASGRITGAVAVFRDVTERRQLERRVAEQASQLEAIFEAKADGAAVFDTRGRFVRANRALREIFGIRADGDYISRSLSERSERVKLFDEQDQLIPEEQWPQWRVLRGENLAGANAMDTRLRTLDGREVWISTTGAPVYGPDREVTGVVLVTRDVTARRELERQAAEQANRLQAVFEAMTDGVAVFEQFGRPVLANQAWQDMLLHIADLRGQSADPAFSAMPFPDQVELLSRQTPVGPDGRIIPLERMPSNRALKGETLTGQDAVDERVEGPDGRVFESSVSAAPVRDAAGHIIGAVVVSRDVTARRALERRVAEQESLFRTLVENSPDIISRFDRNLRLLYISPSSEAVLGIPPDARLNKTYAESGVPEAAYAPWEEGLRKVFATGRPYTFETSYQGDARAPRISRVTYVPEFAADGSVETVLGITTDITELKQTEMALRQSEERFARAFHQSPIAMAIIARANQRILDVNAAQSRLTGYSHSELVGKSMTQLRLMSPLDSGAYRLRVRREGGVVEVPVSIRTKSGEVRFCLWSMGPIQVGGEPCLIMTTRDVTEREQAEESLRAAKAAAEAAQREEEQRRAEAERRERIAASLREILTILNSDRQFGKTLEYITRQVGQLLNSDAAAIYTADTEVAQGERPGARTAQEEALTLQASFGLRAALTSARGKHRLSVGNAAVRRAMEAQRPVAVLALPVTPPEDTGTGALPQTSDMRMEPEEQAEQVGGDATDYIEVRQELLPSPYCALLAIPIVSQGQAYGSLLLLYTTPRRFSADEIALAMAYGDQIALAAANARLQDHIAREATENERNRLARELHDTVTQEIFTASVLSQSIPRVWEQHRAEAEARLGEVHRLISGALAALRALLLELRPAVLEQKALDELLRQLAEVMATRANVPIDLTIADDCPPIPNAVKVAFYRIAQEALMNTAKYANAQHIAVRLRCLRGAREAIQLEVQDDGQGFDPSAIPAGHFGLGMMRERARTAGATLRIASRPQQGTRIAVKWPQKETEQRRADSTDQENATLRA